MNKSLLNNNLIFHHLGIACKDIKTDYSAYSLLGYSKESDYFIDKTQKIKALFIAAEGFPRLELIENLYEQGPLNSLLARGIKIYHIAFQTADIERDAQILCKESNAKIFTPIVPATYFSFICFLMLPNQTIIELVQLRH